MEKKAKWLEDVLKKGTPERIDVKEWAPLYEGVLHKSAVGKIGNEIVIVEKPIIGDPRYVKIGVPERAGGERIGEEGGIITCPSCSSRIRLLQAGLPRDVYCISCGSPLTVKEDMSAIIRMPAAPAPPQPPLPAPPAPTKLEEGPFTYLGYTLYTRPVRLKGGKEQTIYFFSKQIPKSGTAIPKPEGYEVGVNRRSGLPFLRKTGAVKEAPKIPVKKEAPEMKDDLTLIKGISKVYQKRLNAAGISTYKEILKHTPKELSLIATGGRFGNRAAREKWKMQAKRLIRAERR